MGGDGHRDHLVLLGDRRGDARARRHRRRPDRPLRRASPRPGTTPARRHPWSPLRHRQPRRDPVGGLT
ncbi:hypothetical protein N869_09335 [Cellulomonas bogoriensis 69B4 = DSM 16987]|uniref:Uncharacterized protein n=1 Tax=Cellulomonas bogoriensis 69B4 = DSM 16987 TaxID=1386082 RepID=A0A0A0C0X4_9CELL|nr:hypothetical protein N869_09335 [Cellulomonas bogoriensis 69B4 = DSM 16987]